MMTNNKRVPFIAVLDPLMLTLTLTYPQWAREPNYADVQIVPTLNGMGSHVEERGSVPAILTASTRHKTTQINTQCRLVIGKREGIDESRCVLGSLIAVQPKRARTPAAVCSHRRQKQDPPHVGPIERLIMPARGQRVCDRDMEVRSALSSRGP